MPSWQSAFFAQLSRIVKPRGPIGTPGGIVELRRQYTYMSERYGAISRDTIVEAAHLGTVKGEWVRVEETAPQRLIVYLHGGGYVSGSPETHRPLVARLCKAAEAAAISVAYRLAPEFPFPAGLRDSLDAYRHLITKGLPPRSIVLAGDGAGGGLAFATLLAIRNAGLPMPAACVAMSPWADLSLSGWSVLQNRRNDAVFSWEMLFASARHYLKGGSPADPYVSPVFGNFHDFPPIMVHAGSLELLRDDASRLGERAAEAGVPVSVEIYDAMQHVFQAYPFAPEAKVSLNRIGHFIKSRTSDKPAQTERANAKKADAGAGRA